MEIEKALGQLFIIGLDGPHLTDEEAKYIVDNNIGGVILMGRNVVSPDQVYQLCSDLKNLTPQLPGKHPLFIGTDMEGGRVLRFKAPFTKWPCAKKIGQLNSSSMAFRFSQAMGEELRSVGVNLNFAPCLDIDSNPNNPVIGDRSLSSDPKVVTQLGSALVRGYIKAQIICCAKHFPGHGNTSVDSHLELPVETTRLETLKQRELVPFSKIFRSKLPMIMSSHILFKNIDPDNPVTFSKKLLGDLIRTEFKYDGVIVSDDLDMLALRNHHAVEDIPLRALDAGVDILLYCNEPQSPRAALESLKKAFKNGTLSKERIIESYDRTINLKNSYLTPLNHVSLDEAKALIGCDLHQSIANAIESGEIPDDLKSMPT